MSGTLKSLDFEREVGNLNRCKHAHIVELLFSIVVGEPEKESTKYLLGFPTAKGTLEELIRKPPEILTTDLYTLAKWFLVQCIGLSGGVNTIHDNLSNASKDQAIEGDAGKAPYGIHSDIKPANILWFEPPTSSSSDKVPLDAQTLQLGDFGITTFHSEGTRSNNQHGARTKTYASPESENSIYRNSKSRAFDIWSLGCVFLEILSYLVLQDPDFAKKFSQDRAAAVRSLDQEGRQSPTFQGTTADDTSVSFDTFFAMKPDWVWLKGVKTEIHRAYLNGAVRDVSSTFQFL